MLLARLNPHDALEEIEWNTLFFFVGPVHPGRGDRPGRDRRRDRGRGGQATGGDAHGGHDRRSSGSPRCVSADRRQHPVHGHRDPDRPAPGARRAPGGADVVGPLAGCLPGRQPDDRRRLGEHRGREHGRAGRAHDHASCSSSATGAVVAVVPGDLHAYLYVRYLVNRRVAPWRRTAGRYAGRSTHRRDRWTWD